MALLVIATSFWGGLLCGELIPTPLGLLLSAGSGALALRRSRLGVLGAGLTAFLLGTLLPEREPLVELQVGLARITAETSRTSCGQHGCWTEARLTRCIDIDAGTCPTVLDVRIGLASPEEPPLGSTVTAIAKLSPRLSFHNPSPHPPWGHRPPPITASTSGTGVPLGITDANWLGRAITAVRVTARNALERSLGAPHAGIARALLLGDGTAVDRELDAAIRQAGVSHVLAVSGMHVTVLAGALVAVVRRLWLWSPGALYVPASRVAGALGVLLSPLVACLCGGAPSAWRAAFTSTFMFAVQALGRRPCPLRVSAFAIVVYGAADPIAARHPGFVLSVLATIALLTAQREGASLWATFLESARAWLSTTPFLVWSFGSTSFVALFANVVLMPLGAALIPVAVAHLGASLLGLGGFTAWAFELASGAFVGASRLLAGVDPGWMAPPLTPLQGGALAIVALSWLARVTVRTRLIVAAACLVVMAASEIALRCEVAEDEVRVTFLDVGQGDATLIEVGTSERVLIDGGGAVNGGPDPGAQAIVPLLRALRIDALDVVVLSHPHPDHYGGLFAVLDAVRVRELWDTGQAEAEQPNGAASRLLSLARARGARVLGPSALCKAPRVLGALTLEVVAPCPAFDEGLGPNDNSLVIRVVHGQRSFLFTGDVEHEAEAELAKRPSRLSADVLKVPHHGSRTSTTPAFLQAVSPRWAVISAGRNNRFGHPHADVEERLRERVPEVLRLDQRGGVQLVSDGVEVRVVAWGLE